MNYFELYEIPVSFLIDPGLLNNQFNKLSKQYPRDDAHPEQVSEVDKAYRIFSDPDQTIRYVLLLKNLLEPEGHYEPDPQFMMEVTDLNQELVELQLDENRELLMNMEQKATQLLNTVYDQAATIIETYQDGVTTEEELLQVREFYYKKKYLQRILDRIKGIRNIDSPL